MKQIRSSTYRITALAAGALMIGMAMTSPSNAASKTTKKGPATTKANASKSTVAATVPATAAATTAAPEPQKDLDKVNIAVDGFALGAPVYVGLDKGTFKAQGIDAKPVTFQTGVDGLRALSSGQVDFAVGLDFATVSSMSPNLAIVGTIASPLPGFHRLVERQEISGSKDLFGRKMGVLAGTSQDYVTQRWLEVNGLAGKVELVPLPGAFELVAALKTNQIQAAFLFTTALATAREDISLKVLGDDSDVLKTQGIYLLTTAKIASEKADLVKRVLLAEDAAIKFLNANTDEASKIVAKGVKGDAAALKATFVTQRFGIGFSTVQRDVLLGIQKYLIGLNKIPASTDISKSFVLDPLRQAIPGRVGF